jgi:hypothetical protein
MWEKGTTEDAGYRIGVEWQGDGDGIGALSAYMEDPTWQEQDVAGLEVEQFAVF